MITIYLRQEIIAANQSQYFMSSKRNYSSLDYIRPCLNLLTITEETSKC